ncbi:MAG: Cache, type 2 domain protein [Proteobacteria bacterium]|nr:Cache, type 2 domain protein [Pseudomonadota bacterium]
MKALVLGFAMLGMLGGAVAGEKEDAVQLVGDAVAAGVAEIGNAKGRFVKGELYVFAYDLTGTMVAHPINPKLVGKNLLDVPDAGGKMFRQEIVDGVKRTGVVTVDYKYKNPKSGAIEDKVTYCKKAADLAVCAGYYK